MQETNEERLSKANAEVEDFEEQIATKEEFLRKRGALDRPVNFDLQEQLRPDFMELDSLRRKLNDARQRQLALQLTLLNMLTARLNQSSELQLAAAEILERSSHRLEFLTGALILLTAVAAIFGSSAYFLPAFKEAGFSGTQALGLVFIGTMAVVALIFFGLSLLAWQSRRKANK